MTARAGSQRQGAGSTPQELQYLEYTTAKSIYESNGEMANAMLGGNLEDPFASARQYKARITGGQRAPAPPRQSRLPSSGNSQLQ